VQLELERGDDAEVAAAAAQAPEELGLRALAGVHEAPVGGHDIGADKVVEREAVLAHQVADAAAEREAGDAGRRHQAAGGGQAELLRLGVDVLPQAAALDDDALGVGVDADAVHRAEVDEHAALDRREAGDAVAAALHGDLEARAAREPDRGDDVGCAGAAHDEVGPGVVEHAVPACAGVVVAGVAVAQHLAAQALSQFLDRRISERVRPSVAVMADVPLVVVGGATTLGPRRLRAA
jgi:hypothetical protein